MNTTQVVRATPDPAGITLRLWIDDERACHVCVAEQRIGIATLQVWLRDILEEKADADQGQLNF